MTRHVIISCVLIACTGCANLSPGRAVVSNDSKQRRVGSSRASGQRETQPSISVQTAPRDQQNAQAVAGIIKGLHERIESLEQELDQSTAQQSQPTVIQTGLDEAAGVTRAVNPANGVAVVSGGSNARPGRKPEFQSPFNAGRSESLSAALNRELDLLDNELDAAGVVSGLDLNQDRPSRESEFVEELPRPTIDARIERAVASRNPSSPAFVSERNQRQDEFLPPREPTRIAGIHQADPVTAPVADSLDDRFVPVDSGNAVEDVQAERTTPVAESAVVRHKNLPKDEPQPKSVADVQEVVRHAKRLYRAQQFDTAEELFRQINLAKLPAEDRLPVQYMVAMCLKRQGKTSEAIRVLTEIAITKSDDVLITYAKWELAGLTKSEAN